MKKRLTYLEAIRKYCIWCVGGQIYKLDELCIGEECPLYPFRHKRDTLKGTNREVEIVVCGEKIKRKHYTPLKAIRQKCLDCSSGDKAEVRNCICYEGNPEGVEPCPLWIYRMGKNPFIKRKKKGEKNGIREN